MKILLVIDQFDNSNNGTTISARRFAQGLEKAGHTVRVISTGNSSENKYVLKEVPLPIGVSHIIKSQGMTFAVPNSELLEKAMSDVDVVHFYMPFLLSRYGLKIAKRLNIPHTSAFHVQPENITYTIGLGTKKKVNDAIYSFYRDKFFNYFSHIHCPSNFIANQLKEHGYTANLHVISNGISSEFCFHRAEKPVIYQDKFIITMIGRYSNEKRQDILINAISRSKYADKIQLILAGKGPKKQSYMELGKKLKNPPIFQFYNQQDLINLLSYTDLYVHAADAEIEAISCIEAFACGNVPVIADSKQSATPQFALNNYSLFEAGNSNSLANQIDFWIEHPKYLAEMRKKYAEHAKQYHIENSISKIERMFEDAIRENK